VAKHDLTIETIVFNHYTQPNEALERGEIDANAFQHLPYLENQIKTQGYKIVPVGYTGVWPIGKVREHNAEFHPAGAEWIKDMVTEFDPAKDAANLTKHKVSLAFGAEIFGDPDHIVIKTERERDGEKRRKVIGKVANRLWTGVHVMRGKKIRFISVRRSNDGEARIYDQP